MGLGDFQCLVGQGYAFAVLQAWQGGYGMTTNVGQNVHNAFTAGMAHCDVYIFMCPNCDNNGNAADVVNTVVNNLSGVPYGMIWFDIEQCSGCWGAAATNAQYMADAVNTAVGRGVHVGIYSSEYEWSATVGTFSGFTAYPLWYAHYDGQPNFGDSWAYQFGGWKTPAIKQFADSGTSCCSADLNWYPSSFMAMRNATLSKPQPMIDKVQLAKEIAALRNQTLPRKA